MRMEDFCKQSKSELRRIGSGGVYIVAGCA